jgi:hypothetical protein
MLRSALSVLMVVSLLSPPGMCMCGVDAANQAILCTERSTCPSGHLISACCECDCSLGLIHSGEPCPGMWHELAADSFPGKRSHCPGCPASVTGNTFYSRTAQRSGPCILGLTCWDAALLSVVAPIAVVTPHVSDQVVSSPPIYLAGCTLLI